MDNGQRFPNDRLQMDVGNGCNVTDRGEDDDDEKKDGEKKAGLA
jgi:hypothetical protein